LLHPDDTIVAISSAPGPGVRGIVRLSGAQSRSIVESLFHSNVPLKPGRVAVGTVQLSHVPAPLPADVYWFRAPNSYTGQDLAEIHTIGSPPLLEQLVLDILNAGARPAQPGEFTLRAFLAGKKDLTQSEAVLAVIESRNDTDLNAALVQLAGGITLPIAAMREDLLNLLADVEAALDFVDEDIEFVSHEAQLNRIAAALAQLTLLQRQLSERTVSGRAMRVAIVGEPNAGKSSLFNALIGSQAAIVDEQAGTTRDYLVHPLRIGEFPIELIDTAGWQTATNTIESQSQSLGQAAAAQADLLLWCVPMNELPNAATRTKWLQRTGAEVLLVRTKSDLAPVVLSAEDEVDCSAIAKNGLDLLKQTLHDFAERHARPPLAPSQSRCKHHVETAIQRLREAHNLALFEDPPELLALALRAALDQIGEMSGAILTNDLLDRIFSRFCIGK